MIRSGEGNSHNSPGVRALGSVGGLNRKHRTRKMWHCAPRRTSCSFPAAVTRGPGCTGKRFGAVKHCQLFLGPTASISRYWHVPEWYALPVLLTPAAPGPGRLATAIVFTDVSSSTTVGDQVRQKAKPYQELWSVVGREEVLLSMVGRHQVQNAAAVASVISALRQGQCVAANAAQVRSGLENAHLPGRFTLSAQTLPDTGAVPVHPSCAQVL